MPKKEFTATEVMALQEQTLKEVRVVAEQIYGINKTVNEIKEDVSVLKEDMKIVKLSLTLKANQTVVDNHETRIRKLEKTKA